MRDVYDPKQRSYRVQFACSYILREGGSGLGTSRSFDTCFQMGDSSEVAARVYKRALKNPRLMELLPKYLSLKRCQADYERIFVNAPHGRCSTCEQSLTRIEARDRSHKCGGV